jgi:hypothetical protein
MSSNEIIETWISKVEKNLDNLEEECNHLNDKNDCKNLFNKLDTEVKDLFFNDVNKIENEIKNKENKYIEEEDRKYFINIEEECKKNEENKGKCRRLRRRFLYFYNFLMNNLNRIADKLNVLHRDYQNAGDLHINQVLIGREWLFKRINKTPEQKSKFKDDFINLDKLYDKLRQKLPIYVNKILNDKNILYETIREKIKKSAEVFINFLLTPQIPKDEYIEIYNIFKNEKITKENILHKFKQLTEQYMENTDENWGLLNFLNYCVIQALKVTNNEDEVENEDENKLKKEIKDLGVFTYYYNQIIEKIDTKINYNDIGFMNNVMIPEKTILYRSGNEKFRNIDWFGLSLITASRYLLNDSHVHGEYITLKSWSENIRKLFIYNVKEDIKVVNLTNKEMVLKISNQIEDEDLKEIFNEAFRIEEEKVKRKSLKNNDLLIANWLKDKGYNGYIYGSEDFHNEIMIINPEKFLELEKELDIKELGFDYNSYPYNLVDTIIDKID